jgi:hypothetical protein
MERALTYQAPVLMADEQKTKIEAALHKAARV